LRNLASFYYDIAGSIDVYLAASFDRNCPALARAEVDHVAGAVSILIELGCQCRSWKTGAPYATGVASSVAW
jgi:hypothetical protein